MFRKRKTPVAVAVLACALALAAPAGATTIGPNDLSGGAGTVGAGAIINYGFADQLASFNGTVTSWSANFNCASAGASCAAQLLVLRPKTGMNFAIVGRSAVAHPGASGIATFSTFLKIHANDRLAVLTSGSTGVMAANAPDPYARLYTVAPSGDTVSYSTWLPAHYALFNGDVTPSYPSTTTVDAVQATPGGDVAYAIHVSPSTAGGTVSLKEAGAAIPGCQDVAVVSGEATCAAPPANGGTRTIAAAYSGDLDLDDSAGTTTVAVVAPTTATVDAVAAPPVRSAPVTYTARVAPVPAAGADGGTVAFRVDGTAVSGCAAQPVDRATGVASCATTAPATRGTHALTAAYGGAAAYAASAWSAETTFATAAPVAAAPAAADFGTVLTGAAATRTVTVSNTGTDALAVATATLTGDGAFTVTSDTCTGATVAIAQTCTVQLAFTPTAAGARTAALDVATDGGTRHVALTATGKLPAVTPPAPDPDPAPPAAEPPAAPAPLIPVTPSVPGPPATVVSPPVAFTPARLAKTTLTATTARTLSAPLSCATACAVTGTLTSRRLPGTLARLARVRLAAGTPRVVRLTLSQAATRTARRQHLRRVAATLTLTTTYADGTRAVTREAVTIVLPS
ncbi:MAG TPA: Ig-like domain repeat protein [Baekduia sp.]|nr:Ig-like domain repeat protein [Baekduia sp.]